MLVERTIWHNPVGRTKRLDQLGVPSDASDIYIGGLVAEDVVQRHTDDFMYK